MSDCTVWAAVQINKGNHPKQSTHSPAALFFRDKFGWAPAKVDELLSPVLKAYEQRSAQLTMDQFLSFNQRFAKIRSKRLQKAVTAITGGRADPDM